MKREPALHAAAAAMVLCLQTHQAAAAGKIYYGSRAGMQVSVVSMSGLDTSRALIRTKHTREDAVAFCREYVGKVTPECVREELQTPLNDEISADCVRGTFVDFRGNRYRFAGLNKDPNVDAKYRIISLPSGEVANGSSASGYPVNIDIFRALCPSRAPGPE